VLYPSDDMLRSDGLYNIIFQANLNVGWTMGLNHLFPNFFPKPIFPKSLEKFGKSLWKKFG
jgi:hypothetical protein